MSTENNCSKSKLAIRLVALIVAIGLYLVAFGVNQVKSDDVLDYFTDRTAAVYKSSNPLLSGVNFSFVTTTLFQPLGEKSTIVRTDTSSARMYFSFGELDSTQILIGEENYFNDSLFWASNIFTCDYSFDFFPNDIGGAYVAIGFDTDSAYATKPIGIAQVDRDRYFLHRLFLYYPNRTKHECFSRQINFGLVDSYLFPDSIIETGAKAGVFIAEYFRRTIIIKEIIINH